MRTHTEEEGSLTGGRKLDGQEQIQVTQSNSNRTQQFLVRSISERIDSNFKIDFLLIHLQHVRVFAKQKITSTNSGDDDLLRQVHNRYFLNKQSHLFNFYVIMISCLEMKLTSLKSEEIQINFCRLDH